MTPAAPVRQTQIAIVDGRWHLNGHITYPGAPAEGLLMNVRMVNAVFEDRARPDWSPEANTLRFVARIPDYVVCGVRAFTLCLQGGMPGYEGALNSAFAPDGALREDYMRRVRHVIEVCDRQGAVVILGCLYQRQSRILRDAAAVRRAIIQAATWASASGFGNVMLEIANEYGHGGFAEPLLKTAAGQVELIGLAKAVAPGVLVSTSGRGDGVVDESVARASDVILIHFNQTPLEEIPARIAAMRAFGKPVVCNEDDKVGELGAAAARACVANGASWGFMHERVNQRFPFAFNGPDDDPVVYDVLRELTTSGA